MDIGSKGLAEVNLIIPQGTSLAFTIDHEDSDGNPVDHTSSTMHMAFESKDGKVFADLSEYAVGTATGVTVFIPPEVTDGLSIGKMLWDLIVDTVSGDTVRLAYGTVSIVDTYALDGD